MINPRSSKPRLRRASIGGMTLLEVAISLAIFAIGSAGIIECYSLYNAWAARNRCAAVAESILRAKIGKVLSDAWDVNVPAACVVTNGTIADVADPTDAWDVACNTGASVILVANPNSPTTGFVTGNLTRRTRAFETASASVIIDYTLTYVLRGTTYTVTASTVRARDR